MSYGSLYSIGAWIGQQPREHSTRQVLVRIEWTLEKQIRKQLFVNSSYTSSSVFSKGRHIFLTEPSQLSQWTTPTRALSTCLNFSHSLKHFHHPDYNVVFYMSSSKAQDPKPHLRSMIRDGVMIQSLFNVSAISSFDRKRWKEDILLDSLSVTRTTVCRRA